MTHWFEVIRKVVQDPRIQLKNCYNIDETGVILSTFSSIKVLIDREDLQDYRDHDHARGLLA